MPATSNPNRREDRTAQHAAMRANTSTADPLREVRALKRWVQLGVYGAILGSEPFYYFVLHYGWAQLLVGLAIGMVIATSAIEWAFGQIFKLRRRSAYPNVLFVEIGSVDSVAAACGPALVTVNRLLGAAASFLACLGDDGALKLEAASGISRDEAEPLLRSSASRQATVDSTPLHSSLSPDRKLSLVPVTSLQRTIGLLGVIGDPGSASLKDDQLLTAIGMALGLSFENLRQKEELREGQERLQTVVSGAPLVLFAIDRNGIFTLMEGKALAAIGVAPADVVGRSVFEVYESRPEAADEVRRALAGEEVVTTIEIDGAFFEGRLTPMRDEGGELDGIVGVFHDITEQTKAKNALLESETRYRSLFESARDVIYTVDAAGMITSLNPAFETVTGWSRADWLGRSFAPIVHPDDLPAVIERFQRLLSGGMAEPETHEWRVRNKTGEYLTGEFVPVPQMQDGVVTGAIGFVRDITERRKAEETIRRLAYRDSLTGLHNRTLFEDRLNLALSQAKRSHQMIAVMFLDLDRFKIVNDTLGHAAGDALLREVANELASIVREGDTVARVGGDEFVFLLTGLAKAEDAILVADRILERLKAPRLLDGQEFTISTSIGITLFPRDAKDAETLLHNSDTAMYRAKERGRDNYLFYSPSMEVGLGQRLALENDLRHALERHEMLVHYQPVAEVATGAIVGAEALVRWNHPQRGMVSPEDFIPLAEEVGLISDIGDWVLRAACRQTKEWHDRYGLPIVATVNISARQLERDGLVTTVAGVLNETGLPGPALHLEITEGAMMKNVESIIAMLEDLQAMGVGITVDDFGTGYSSLSYLKRFPITTIKIDRTFVRDIVTDASDAAIVNMVITMAHDLKLDVVAEGVETKEQLAFLRARDCDKYQGYLKSAPLTPEEFGKLLSTIARRSAKIIPLKPARVS